MMTMVLRSCCVFTNEQWNHVEPPSPEVGWEVSWLRRLRAGQSSDQHDSIRHGQVINLGLWGEIQFFLPWSQLDASGKAVLFSALATWLQWDKVVEHSFSDTWLSINGVPKERWISITTFGWYGGTIYIGSNEGVGDLVPYFWQEIAWMTSRLSAAWRAVGVESCYLALSEFNGLLVVVNVC